MRYALAVVTTVAAALWFGGTMALFLFVTTLFQIDREIGIEIAPQVFLRFEKCQLVLAAVAVIGAFAWRMLVHSRWITAVFFLLGLATVAATISSTIIT